MEYKGCLMEASAPYACWWGTVATMVIGSDVFSIKWESVLRGTLIVESAVFPTHILAAALEQCGLDQSRAWRPSA